MNQTPNHPNSNIIETMWRRIFVIGIIFAAFTWTIISLIGASYHHDLSKSTNLIFTIAVIIPVVAVFLGLSFRWMPFWLPMTQQFLGMPHLKDALDSAWLYILRNKFKIFGSLLCFGSIAAIVGAISQLGR